MDDRYSRYGRRDYFGGGAPTDTGRDYGYGRDYEYSSARDYAAAGWDGRDDDRNQRNRWRGGERTHDWGSDRSDGYSSSNFRSEQNRSNYGERSHRDRDQQRPPYGYGNRPGGDYSRDRGFFERAGDEVRAWFGDEEAERRREMDQRYDERAGRGERWRDSSGRDDHYTSWRRQRIAELDRDYDEYRRENAQRFENEFTSWRSERQGQRDQLRRVTEHMEVIGSDGAQVGTVDKVRGDRIILTKNDAGAGGHHHSIPSRWIQSVEDKVTIRKTAEEAKAHWRDEDSAGAFFGEGRDSDRNRDDQDWSSERNLNRSFSGTY